jgi:hypothetical protein
MGGVDPSLLENVLRACGYSGAADALHAEVERGQESASGDLAGKVASLEGRLAAAEQRTASGDDQRRAEGERMLSHMKRAGIGPWSWTEGGDDAA